MSQHSDLPNSDLVSQNFKIFRLYCHVDTCKYTKLLNPSRLAPVKHTHAHPQGHKLMEIDAIYTGAMGSHSQHPGSMGGTVPCSRAPRPWQRGVLPPLQLSVHQSLSRQSGNRTANLPVIGPTLTTDLKFRLTISKY